MPQRYNKWWALVGVLRPRVLRLKRGPCTAVLVTACTPIT